MRTPGSASAAELWRSCASWMTMLATACMDSDGPPPSPPASERMRREASPGVRQCATEPPCRTEMPLVPPMTKKYEKLP